MSKFSLVVIALLTYQWVSAQSFNNTYVHPNIIASSFHDYNHMLLSAETDDGYIKAGYLTEHNNPSNPTYFEVSIAIIKVDNWGNIMWSRKIGKANYDVWPAAIIPGHSPGEVIIVGNKDPKSGSLSTSGNAIALKIDNASGNTIWENEFNTGQFNSAEVVQAVPGTNIYVLAGQWAEVNTNVRLQAIAFDDLGTLMWANQYETPDPGEGKPTSICYRPTRNVVKIMGLVDSHNGTFTIGLDPSTGAVAELYIYFFYGGDEVETAGFIQPTSDGGYIMALHTAQSTAPGVFGGPNAVLVKVDNTVVENVTWSKRYDNVPWGLAVYENPTISGQYDMAVELLNSKSESVPGLLSVNSTGTAIQLMRYDTYEGTKTHCMIPDAQGGYLISAGYLSSLNNVSGFQLVKTDVSHMAPCADPVATPTSFTPCSPDHKITLDYSNGTDVSPVLSNVVMNFAKVDCDGSGFKRSTGLDENRDAVVTIYPNPVDGVARITGLNQGEYQIDLVNVLGKTILRASGSTTGEIEMDLTEVKPGNYILEIKQKDEVDTHKMVRD